jgi:hypothetical protein
MNLQLLRVKDGSSATRTAESTKLTQNVFLCPKNSFFKQFNFYKNNAKRKNQPRLNVFKCGSFY